MLLNALFSREEKEDFIDREIHPDGCLQIRRDQGTNILMINIRRTNTQIIALLQHVICPCNEIVHTTHNEIPMFTLISWTKTLILTLKLAK